MEGGCFVPVSHKLNHDGYFRKSWGNDRSGDRYVEFFHRVIYRLHHGLESIPDGFEIDHICHNRACCNVSHLDMIDGSHHAVITNQKRKRDCDEAGVHYGTRSRKRVVN